MKDPLFGQETEYEITAQNSKGLPLDREGVTSGILTIARQRFPYLNCMQESKSIFLANGGRFYIDSGDHPEYCTPECSNPGDIVRYQDAGDMMLEKISNIYKLNHPDIRDITISRCNVDYINPGATWGCHESYLHKNGNGKLAKNLLPFLVSRLIFCGAGGFDSTSPGLVFLLSPRAPHMKKSVSSTSTTSRGIFHTKNEALCGNGYSRCHIMCGERLCSAKATWLKIATTSLVMTIIDAGKNPGTLVELEEPIVALQTFSADTSCRVMVPTILGQMSAKEIQQHYLEEVRSRLGRYYMPSWAKKACIEWEKTLNVLRKNPMQLSRSHDAYIKYALYSHFLEKNGVNWEWVRRWTEIIKRNPDINKKGLKKFFTIRNKLFEMDTRFGQLGKNGIFNSLDKAGVLEHAPPDIYDMELALNFPPKTNRARIRGEYVKKLSGGNGRYRCYWDSIEDNVLNRVIDMSDPFNTNAKWRDRTPKDETMDMPGFLRRRIASLEERNHDFHVGDRVILGKHGSVNGGENWNRQMERHVGRKATITAILGSDCQGCIVARVDRDGGDWVWRLRDMKQADR